MSEEQDQQNNNTFKPALLTRTEIEWLCGKVQGLSKAYERRLRFTIRHKIKTLTEVELPLLVKNGYVMTKCNAVTTDYNAMNPDNRLIPNFVLNGNRLIPNFVLNGSPGLDSNQRSLSYQDSALPN